MEATTSPRTHDLHLDRLRAFHESLVAALGESGYGGERLASVLGGHVRASCAQCGIAVTGEDIAAALAAESAHVAANPRHARLLQHYCARNGCPSYYYRVEFQPVPGIDWERCLARAAALESGEDARKATDAAARSAAVARKRRRQFLKIGAGGVALAGLWVLRRWWVTGSLPGIPEKPKYQIDPRSIPPDSRGGSVPRLP